MFENEYTPDWMEKTDDGKSYDEKSIDLEAKQLRKHIRARRQLAEEQTKATDIQAKLCEDIRAEKNAVEGLAARIRRLEFSDPELFKYIQRLEFIQDGIWCARCHQIKNVGIPAPIRTEESTVRTAALPERATFKKLRTKIHSLHDVLNTVCDDFQKKIQILAETTSELEQNLMKLGIGIDVKLGDLVPQTVPSVEQNTQTVESVIKNYMDLDSGGDMTDLELGSAFLDEISSGTSFTAADFLD